MPADLTPEKALEKLLAMCERDERWRESDKPWMGGPSVTVESVRAILARVTPSETPEWPPVTVREAVARQLYLMDERHESEWSHQHHIIKARFYGRADAVLAIVTPTAVPGAGEVERVGVQYAKNVRGGGFNLNEDYVHDAEWHIEASADTGTSHTLPGRLYVVQCEWCPAAFAAHTKREAMELFRSHESEQRVIDETGDER